MNSISIWQDKILLQWDGVVPAEALAKNAVHEPNDVLDFWPHITQYARWSKRTQTFMLAFSKQNMLRLHKQFGAIQVKSGNDRIAQLKLADSFWYDIAQKSQKVRMLPFDKLPQYQYKVPPLAEYQHRGVVFLRNVKRAPLFADCGCVAWDTVVSMNRNGCGLKFPIHKAYEVFHSPRRKACLKIRSFDGKIIRLHDFYDVKQSGIKSVYRLRLLDGRYLKATADHGIMTDKGMVALGALSKDDLVMVDNLTKHSKKSKPAQKAKKLGDARRAVGDYHPYARKQFTHNRRLYSNLIEIHRAIYEASLNGMELEEFIAATYTKKGAKLKFIDPKIYGIHHKNMDHYDNAPENLEALPHAEHYRLHMRGYKGYSHFGHGIPEYSKVESVIYVGEEMTYDICCKAPHHNFVANGIVVHNSGKTFMVLASTDLQMKNGELTRGKTLISGKLSTLESGWMEDAERFTDLKVTNLWLPSSSKRHDKFLERLNTPSDVYIINHEGLKTYRDELRDFGFEKVVVDESTVLKGFHGLSEKIKGGVLGRALFDISQKADWRVVMSGTPAPNGVADLWGQFYFLDPVGIALEPSFNDFKHCYMRPIDLRSKGQQYKTQSDGSRTYRPPKPTDPVKWVDKPASIPEVSRKTDSVSFRVKIRDHLKDMPELTIMTRKTVMSTEQSKHYKDMLERLKVEINDTRIAVPIRLTQLMKLRQITGGFIIDHQEEVHEISPNPKLAELDSLLSEEIDKDQKVIIWCEYQYEIEAIKRRYKNSVTVYGGNTPAVNLQNQQAFRNNPDVRIILAHPKSMAHGVTLTMAHYMVFYSISHSSENNYQCIKRIERAGQKHPMFVYYLLMSDTIDPLIFKALEVKDKNQSDLIDQSRFERNLLSFCMEEL